MKLNVLFTILVPVILTGCFGGDNADPLEGRQPPAVQEAPPQGVTPQGEKVECSTLRAQDYDKYKASIDQHQQHYQTQMAQVRQQCESTATNHGSQCEGTIEKNRQQYQAALANQRQDAEQKIAAQTKACKEETDKLSSALTAKSQQCQETVDKYKADIEAYRKSLQADKQAVVDENRLLKQQIQQCTDSKKVKDKQRFTGMLYNLTVPQANPISLEFTEGVAAEYRVQTRLFVGKPGVIQSLKITSNATPKGLSITKGSKTGTWVIKWKPPVNLEPGNDTIYRTIEVEPVVDQSKLNKQDRPLVASEELSSKILLVVQRTKVKPAIDITELPQSLSVGQTLPFTVAVKDPAANESNPPSIHIGFGEAGKTTYRNTINGAALVTADASKAPSYRNGVWSFYFKVNSALLESDSDLKAQIAGNERETAIQFQVRVQSQVSGQTTVSQNKLISLQGGQ